MLRKTMHKKCEFVINKINVAYNAGFVEFAGGLRYWSLSKCTKLFLKYFPQQCFRFVYMETNQNN